MAKNRVAPEGKRFSNKKDGFFNKTKTSFKSKDRFQRNKFKPGNSKNDRSKNSFKPSVESGSDFFIKTKDAKTELSKKSETNETEDNATKKPFDKKKWRMQKYSKKYKLDQWEDKRKKFILRGYYNELKHDTPPKLDVQKIYEQDDELNEENENNLNASIASPQRVEEATEESNKTPAGNKQNKNKVFRKAHDEFLRIKEEKQVKKEEFRKRKEEKEQALKEYKQKKAEKFKKLNKKTKKGQPIMKYRMEMLLEQIQNSVKS